jgi:hypothetical protein
VDPGDKGIFALAFRALPVWPLGVVFVAVAGDSELGLRATAVALAVLGGGAVGVGGGGSGFCLFFW